MRIPFRFSAVIFDLDGTLVDTEPLYSEATQKVLDPYDAIFTKSFKKTIMGGDALTGATKTVKEFNLEITPEEFLKRREIYLNELFPNAREINGAPEYLMSLKRTGIRSGLATSSSKKMCDLKIGHRSWAKLLDPVVCGDDPDLSKAKPAPDIFILCAEKMKVSPSKVIVFEDSKNGIRGAKDAGMRVIALRNPFMLEDDLSEADLLIDDFIEILQE